ncbi:MAG: RHS repeat-associated core domain-containing protein, partial [Bacteroidales bacterium]|nr:RHS repeat-associated core domain-containing protein [Bacteroidales bacterium]
HEHMAGFGLINMNGRLYDPYLQRFLSPDPFVQSPTNTQSYNRYTYCLNNPLAFTDPTGYIQQSAFADGCYELTPAYSAFQRAFGLQNFLLNAGRNNTMLAMNPLVAIGLLGNSTSGGSWSRSTGMSYYKSDIDGLNAGCDYNDYFNSWGETEAKSKANARGAFANNMTAEQYLKYMSLTCSIEGGVTPTGGGDGWFSNIDWEDLVARADDFFTVAAMADAQLPIGDVVGLVAVGGARLGKLLFATSKVFKFGGDEAVIHFGRHASQIMQVTGKASYNLANYISDANWIIRNGTYSSQLNGYYYYMGNSARTGESLFGFVGMKEGGTLISTFHIKTVTQLGLR